MICAPADVYQSMSKPSQSVEESAPSTKMPSKVVLEQTRNKAKHGKIIDGKALKTYELKRKTIDKTSTKPMEVIEAFELRWTTCSKSCGLGWQASRVSDKHQLKPVSKVISHLLGGVS